MNETNLCEKCVEVSRALAVKNADVLELRKLLERCLDLVELNPYTQLTQRNVRSALSRTAHYEQEQSDGPN